MINKILRNQRYRGTKESLKFSNDLTEIKIDLSKNKSILDPLAIQKDLTLKNIEERQENLPLKFAEVNIIEDTEFSWEGLNALKLRVRQATEQLKLYTLMIKGA